jgi:large repetitive protein
VTLTVTDNASGTNTTTQDVIVTAPTVTQYAADLFGRTATGAWGSADIGGAWSVGGGATNFSVDSATGQMKLAAAGSQLSAYLNTLSLDDTNTVVDFSVDKTATGGGNYMYVSARHKTTGEYRLRAKLLATGAMQLSLTKVVSGTETVLATANVAGTFAANTPMRMRLQVSGTTTVALTGKMWVAGTAEPAGWQVTSNDATSPLPAGAPGVMAYLSGSSTNAPAAVSWDNFTVSAIGP